MNPEFQHNYVQTIEYIFILGLLIISIITFIFYKNKNQRLLGMLPLLALFAHQVEEYVLSSLILGEIFITSSIGHTAAEWTPLAPLRLVYVLLSNLQNQR